MSRIKELRQKKADLVAQANGVITEAGANAMTETQAAKVDGLMKDIEAVNRDLVFAESLMEHERSLSGHVDPNATADKTGKDDKPKFASFGDQMVAVAQAGINRGQGEIDAKLKYEMFSAASGASEGVAADGGYLVQTDFSTELLKKAYEVGILASRVKRIPISPNANGLKVNAVKETSRANGSRWGGVQAFWTGEAEQLTASRPKFRQMELDLKKLTGLCYATEELLSDSVALGAILQDAFSDEFGFKIDDAIMNGTGAGMPKGYFNSTAMVTVAKEAAQAADTILAENIGAMWGRFWARSRKNAVWLINQQLEGKLMFMKIGDTPIYVPAGGLSGAPYATLLGAPVIPIEQASALGDVGDIQLVDLSQYLMIDKGGIQGAQSMHVRFLYDELVFRFIYRADGQPIWEAPLTPFKGADTLSPFVTLEAR
jgi:HK97 family phage major capsid protein